MKSLQKASALGGAVGLALGAAWIPSGVAQDLDPSLAPRLVIEEVAPSAVEVVGNDVRLLGTTASPQGLVGDQINASLATSGYNGFLVWQDNAIDGNQSGIGSRFLNLQSGIASPQIIRVNQDIVGNQENPKAAVLANGNAIVVWQSGKHASQSIKARLLTRSGAVSGAEFTVAAATDSEGFANAVVASSGTGFVVAWESMSPDGLSRKVQVRRFDSAGAPQGELRLLGTSARIDRSPALTVHADGRIVVAWIAEMANGDVLNLGGASTRLEVNSDLFAAVIQPDGRIDSPVWINGSAAPCDAPAILALPGGGTLVGWSEYSLENRSEWDIRTAVLSPEGVLTSSPTTLNTYRPYEQTGLRFAISGTEALAVWSSRGADGSGLGASARSLNLAGLPLGDEFVVNGSRSNDQFSPTVASTPNGYRVVWSGLTSLSTGIDLQAKELRKQPASNRRLIKLYWNTVPGTAYRVESSTDLATWTEIQTFPSTGSSQLSMTLDPAAVPNTFFRVTHNR